MKILIISHMYPSSFNSIGGVFVHQQVKELQKQGCKIKVISPIPWTPFFIKYFSKKWKRYSEVPQKIIFEGIEIYYPRYLEFPKALFFASSGRRMYYGIKKTVDEIYKNFKFDIIHAHVALPDGYSGMLIAQKYNKPLITTIHGQDFQQTIYKNIKCREYIREIINYSEKVIAVSNKLKYIGEKYLKIDFKKIEVIYNGILQQNIFKFNSNLANKYKDKIMILSVSNLINTKGIDFNIKAVAKLKEKYFNLIYLIIGDGIERKNLKNLAKKLGIEDNVRFLGQLSHQKAMEYISICDIFSLPSWNEAFGIVYIEAMANGKPAIACYGEGIDGIIKNKDTGILVKSKDVDSLVESIDFLLVNPEKAREIGKKAKKLILEN